MPHGSQQHPVHAEPLAAGQPRRPRRRRLAVEDPAGADAGIHQEFGEALDIPGGIGGRKILQHEMVGIFVEQHLVAALAWLVVERRPAVDERSRPAGAGGVEAGRRARNGRGHRLQLGVAAHQIDVELVGRGRGARAGDPAHQLVEILEQNRLLAHARFAVGSVNDEIGALGLQPAGLRLRLRGGAQPQQQCGGRRTQ